MKQMCERIYIPFYEDKLEETDNEIFNPFNPISPQNLANEIFACYLTISTHMTCSHKKKITALITTVRMFM